MVLNSSDNHCTTAVHCNSISIYICEKYFDRVDLSFPSRLKLLNKETTLLLKTAHIFSILLEEGVTGCLFHPSGSITEINFVSD